MGNELTLGDVLNEPLQKGSIAEKEFNVSGKAWTLKASVLAKSEAEEYFRISEISAAFLPDKNGKQPFVPALEVVPPPGKGDRFLVKNPLYRWSLELLSLLVISPRFTVEEWAIAGQRFGASFINEVGGWVIDINGLNPDQINTGAADPKALKSNRSRGRSKKPV